MRSYRVAHAAELDRRRRIYYKANRDRIISYNREYRARNRAKLRQLNNQYNVQVKSDVLSHYGKDGTLCCCWPGCTECDPDILTLDHVENNGATHRKEIGGLTGMRMYPKLRKANYPPGFQTLCANHQLKKEILRRRNGAG